MDGTTTYSCNTLVAGLVLQSTPIDWWCLYWIHGDTDPSVYNGGSHLGEELRRRLLLNLLPRPLLILQVQSDLALVHCPSINGTNLEGETNKQNKQHMHQCKQHQETMSGAP